MQFIFVVFMLLVAGSIWLVFLRPVPRLSAQGVITSKHYKPPGEYTQFPAGDRAGFRQPTRIPIAEGYLVEIAIEDSKESVIALLNSTEAQWYEVGTRVAFDYEERGVPLLWKRVYVLSVRLVGTTTSNRESE